MKLTTKQLIIIGTIGGLCSLSGLFLLGMVIGYNDAHRGEQSQFSFVGLFLSMLGVIIIMFASIFYKKKKDQESKGI